MRIERLGRHLAIGLIAVMVGAVGILTMSGSASALTVVRTAASHSAYGSTERGAHIMGTVRAPAAHKRWHWFSSPTKNIGCVVYKGYARCDVAEHTWRAPHKPRSCHLDWGDGIFLKKKPHWSCAGDTTLGSKKILQYGDSVRYGTHKCISRSTGMVCRNTRTGHGFKVSRSTYRFF